MEIMLNGQLVSCTPKEYKELMDMGLITSPASVATQSTECDITQLHETDMRVNGAFKAL
jgi:hypothetical protein